MARQLVVEILSDAKKFNKGFDQANRQVGQFEGQTKKASNTTSRFGGRVDGAKNSLLNMKNVLGGAIFAGFGAAALRVIGDLDRLGVKAEGIRNQFGVVFGDLADDMSDWANEVNERFGLSEESVQSLASSVQDLLVPVGFARDEAASMTREVLTLANALSEWTGGQVDVADATDRVRKALLGEREGLKALNVSILQSDINARLAAKGQSELTGEALAQAQAMATLEIITDKSADALTAYEKGTNKALIKQKQLNAALEDGKQAFADFVKNELDFGREQAGGLASTLEDLGFILDEVTGEVEANADAQRSWGQRIVESDDHLTFAAAAAQLLRIGLRKLRERFEDDIPFAERYGDAIGNLPDHLTDIGSAAGGAAGGVGDLEEELAKIREHVETIIAARSDFAAFLGLFGSTVESRDRAIIGLANPALAGKSVDEILQSKSIAEGLFGEAPGTPFADTELGQGLNDDLISGFESMFDEATQAGFERMTGFDDFQIYDQFVRYGITARRAFEFGFDPAFFPGGLGGSITPPSGGASPSTPGSNVTFVFNAGDNSGDTRAQMREFERRAREVVGN